jgi:uncharacterized protein with PIN domain
MTTTIDGIRYHGQPIYQDWNEAKTKVSWSSRTITLHKDGSWSIKSKIELKTITIDRRYSTKSIVAKIRKARMELIQLKGVKRCPVGTGIYSTKIGFK